MGQEEYRSCMSGKMKSGRLKGLDKESRRIEFCIIAKTCSGKAKNDEEARVICSQPKPPKPEKTGRRRRSKRGESSERSEGETCLLTTLARVHSGELPAGTDPYDICAEVL